jgi:hypothetical protein
VNAKETTMPTRLLGGLAAVLFVTLLASSACGAPAPAPAVVGAPAGALAEGYPDALNVRNQLLLGTLRLEGGADAVTAEQARQLLPLWQAYKSLTAPGSTAAVQETDAVLAQVQRMMAPQQVAAIAAMRLTTSDLNRYYEALGLPPPPTTVAGAPAPQPGSGGGANLSEADRQATRTARGVTGTPIGGGRGTALLDDVIALLAARAGP